MQPVAALVAWRLLGRARVAEREWNVGDERGRTDVHKALHRRTRPRTEVPRLCWNTTDVLRGPDVMPLGFSCQCWRSATLHMHRERPWSGGKHRSGFGRRAVARAHHNAAAGTHSGPFSATSWRVSP